MTKGRLDQLRDTADWVREEFAGQTTDEQRKGLEAEAANIEWAAGEIERLRDALVAIRGLSRDSTQVGTQAIHEIAVNATISADEPSE